MTSDFGPGAAPVWYGTAYPPFDADKPNGVLVTTYKVAGGYVTEIGDMTGQWERTRLQSQVSASQAWKSYWYDRLPPGKPWLP